MAQSTSSERKASSALMAQVSTRASGRGTSPVKVPSSSVLSCGATTISASSRRRNGGATASSLACIVARPMRWPAYGCPVKATALRPTTESMGLTPPELFRRLGQGLARELLLDQGRPVGGADRQDL